ncbi:MAG: hypothetical protein CUN49_09505 [Candidatus Thermofonsia Clade 1 bacterium]|jgi:hypothetical protein|uniref:Uncharacterized protein n=1 Tax=Candidatus Thermofonsia Clade 1 bacterium TaxID=2364210 RepID=A0A2M8PDL7_9CHLR|nr:MAG: hypothetical protein CUN49_09505 [Candidatus Thermofonsia Clade 1 bacterium]RMF48925.1 MAG: hypothetical protein D6749_14460 [Chloroflexota bacterium]
MLDNYLELTQQQRREIVPAQPSIWTFYEKLSRRLILWNLVNLGAGVLLQGFTSFWRGLGAQAIGWSAVNLAIGFLGQRGNLRRAAQPEAHTPTRMAHEARKIRAILWLNAGLDILYMLGGWRWARRAAQTGGENAEFQRGMGMGVVVQGALLFIWDVINALIVPRYPKED